MVSVPFQAIPHAVWLEAEKREIAAHYRISPTRVMRHEEARDALCWKLIQQRGLTAGAAGERLGLSATDVEQFAKRHETKVDEYRNKPRLA